MWKSQSTEKSESMSVSTELFEFESNYLHILLRVDSLHRNYVVKHYQTGKKNINFKTKSGCKIFSLAKADSV